MNSPHSPGPSLPQGERGTRRRRGLGVRIALVWEVITGGLVELWAHKLRSVLTLTLLMLGVFALVFKVSFETRRRAVVPFVASLSLLIVCSIHLAALANMRVGVISQDEADTRARSIDDGRHARKIAASTGRSAIMR